MLSSQKIPQMCTTSSLTSGLKVAHQSLSYQLVLFSSSHFSLLDIFLFVLLFIIYSLLLECKYCKSQELACFVHCYIPWAWNSSGHVTEASCAHFLNG